MADTTEQAYDAAIESYNETGDVETALRAAGAVAAAGACAAVGAAPAAPVCAIIGDAVVGFVINEVVPFLEGIFGSEPPKPSLITRRPALETLREFDTDDPDFWLYRSWRIGVNNLVWYQVRLGLINERYIDANTMRRVMLDLREAGVRPLRTLDAVVYFPDAPRPHITAVAVDEPLYPPNFWRNYVETVSVQNNDTARAWLISPIEAWVQQFVDRLGLLALAYSAKAAALEAERVAARETGQPRRPPTLRSGPSPAALAAGTAVAHGGTARRMRAGGGATAIGGAVATLGAASMAGAFVPKARRWRPYLLAGGSAAMLGGAGLVVWSRRGARGNVPTERS